MTDEAGSGQAVSQAATPLSADHWHLQDALELARRHGVDPQRGLPPEEAGRRAEQHGPNEIRGRPGRSLLGQFFDQFKDFMIVVLIAAAVTVKEWFAILAVAD